MHELLEVTRPRQVQACAGDIDTMMASATPSPVKIKLAIQSPINAIRGEGRPMKRNPM
jgi:hypothetical protein